ncbi:MAG: prolyl oligopeptidase family serine peptidase [Candidatus Dojkabacteria bacterium]|nr:MAG: prolyl oligopeptidase family serine peptidase [Candidatus Dojkabacteria bacterium]
MDILIIPGFTGYPEEVTFKELGEELQATGHIVTKIAWPHIPDKMSKYSFSETIATARATLNAIESKELIILGFSMGGIIATLLATEFPPKKLGLIVSPYQVGSEYDLAGKYKEWKETGYRKVTSSKFGELSIPFSFIEDAQEYNAIDYIQNVTCPVLFVVGEEDEKVPMSVTRKIFDKANAPKEWCQIPEMEHKYQYQPKVLEEVNKVIVEFIS